MSRKQEFHAKQGPPGPTAGAPQVAALDEPTVIHGGPAAQEESKDDDLQAHINAQAASEEAPVDTSTTVIPAKERYTIAFSYGNGQMQALHWFPESAVKGTPPLTSLKLFDIEAHSPRLAILIRDYGERLVLVNSQRPFAAKLMKTYTGELGASNSETSLLALSNAKHIYDPADDRFTLSRSLLDYLFNNGQKWQLSHRSEIVKLTRTIIQQRHFSDADKNLLAFYSFLFANGHFTEVSKYYEKSNAEPITRRSLPKRAQHIIFSFLMPAPTSVDTLELILLQQIQRSIDNQSWHPYNSFSCALVTLAAMCFDKDPDYIHSQPNAARYFINLLKPLSNERRIAWLGVTQTIMQTRDFESHVVSNFSALYQIARHASQHEFAQVVTFDLATQPLLFQDALRGALICNPCLLPQIIDGLTGQQIFDLINPMFKTEQSSAFGLLPKHTYSYHRDKVNLYEDDISGYVYDVEQCKLNPTTALPDLIVFLLNLTASTRNTSNDKYYWHLLLTLYTSNDDNTPEGKMSLAIAHHYQGKKTLKTVINSFITQALPNLLRYKQHEKALLSIAAAIMQHGNKQDRNEVLSIYLNAASLDKVKVLLSVVPTKELLKLSDTFKFLPTDNYFECLNSIDDSAKRVTVFAALYLANPSYFTQANALPIVDLLRQSIVNTCCEQLDGDTINTLGKFFWPYRRELHDGEKVDSRRQQLFSKPSIHTVTLFKDRTTELSYMAKVPSDFTKGYLITALANFNRRGFCQGNSIHDATKDDAPSRDLLGRL